MSNDSNTKRQPVSLFDLIKDKAMGDTNKYVSQEFQDFGYRLAVELDDLDHKSLYIKLAKTIDRQILESARTFVIDANARSKARLFMWKVRLLKEEAKKKKASSR